MKPKDYIAQDETETIINFSKYQIGEWAEVYTSDRNVMKRFEKFAEKHPDHCKLIREDNYSMTFSIHPKCAAIYPKAPRKVVFTEEQKAALRDRLQSSRTKTS